MLNCVERAAPEPVLPGLVQDARLEPALFLASRYRRTSAMACSRFIEERIRNFGTLAFVDIIWHADPQLITRCRQAFRGTAHFTVDTLGAKNLRVFREAM
jgi:hypothetical protein